MAFQIADRVYETSTTQGTGTLNLAGATAGFQSFVDGVGDGNETYYLIDDGTDWEVGIGTVTSGTPDTLSRDTILESSNSDAAVNWGSGTRNVRISVPAEGFPTLKTDNTFTGANTFQGDVRFTDAGELTIATGEITVTGVYHTVDTEADAASDDLVTINGEAAEQVLIIRPDDAARTVVIKATGNIVTPDGNDIELDDTAKSVTFIYDDALSKWVVVSAPVTVNDASTTEKGIVELLTNAEFNTGTDTARTMTASNFVKSIAASGYITLPGGLIVQWGTIPASNTGTVTFPVAFTTACDGVTATGADPRRTLGVAAKATTTFDFVQRLDDGSNSPTTWTYIAWGR